MPILQGYFESEALETYDYDTNTNLLVLTFRKPPRGPFYYYNVPQPVFAGLRNAGSAGQYFNAVIRGVYE